MCVAFSTFYPHWGEHEWVECTGKFPFVLTHLLLLPVAESIAFPTPYELHVFWAVFPHAIMPYCLTALPQMLDQYSIKALNSIL